MDPVQILVIEDEQRLAQLLKKQLEENGIQPDIASDGYTGRQLAETGKYKLILLDINLPLLNGYDLCREIRSKNSSIPIIMLTAFSSAENKIAGFDSGADDYVTKPFDFRELLARINVFLRRSGIETEHPQKLCIADLEMDLDTKSVTRANRKIDLTFKESALLELLLKNKDRLLTRDFIIEKVWGIDFDPLTNIIDVYVNYLRRKIDKDHDIKLIHTKYGFGFYCSEKEL
jgi:two-component system, OmpR family, copper resistance phosphate regulon response regulator CusR